jgi:predicted transcriptional regulator
VIRTNNGFQRTPLRGAVEANTFGIRWATRSEVRRAGWTFTRRRCILAASGYTCGMKTAISIPDDVFADAEQLARELKKSRSRLYGDAVREYIARHSAESITESVNRVCDEVDRRGEFGRAAATRTLERSDW